MLIISTQPGTGVPVEQVSLRSHTTEVAEKYTEVNSRQKLPMLDDRDYCHTDPVAFANDVVYAYCVFH